MGKIIAVENKKGGVGKTTTSINFSVGLQRIGKKVLLVDMDPQGNATGGLGFSKTLKKTIKTAMEYIIMDADYNPEEFILHSEEGIDVIAANDLLSVMDIMLVNVKNREFVLKKYLERIKDKYDYILIDGMPSLGMLTINVLTAADVVLIPVQTQPYGVEGLQDVLQVISNTQKHLNPGLQIGGIFYAIDYPRTRQSQKIKKDIKEAYGKHIRICNSSIAHRVAISEAPGYGMSVYRYIEEVKNKEEDLSSIIEDYMSAIREVVSYEAVNVL